MLRGSRVLFWCLLAGCTGGPISDFPKGAQGNDDESSGSPKPPADRGDGDEGEDDDSPPVLPPTSSGDGDHDGVGNEFGDGDSEPAGDAGAFEPERPCESDPGGADAGVLDGGVCTGDACAVTRAALDQITPRGACSSSAEKSLVCEAQVQRAIGRCNESSLSASAGFGLVANCALTDPGLSLVSEPCLECYLEANRCTLLNCLAECITPSADEACKLCRAHHCGEALSACTGLPLL